SQEVVDRPALPTADALRRHRAVEAARDLNVEAESAQLVAKAQGLHLLEVAIQHILDDLFEELAHGHRRELETIERKEREARQQARAPVVRGNMRHQENLNDLPDLPVVLPADRHGALRLAVAAH